MSATDISGELKTYLKENPAFLLEFVAENPDLFQSTSQQITESLDIQGLLDSIFKVAPFTFPDQTYSLGGTTLTPYHIAGVVVPVAIILILLIFMRNSAGFVFIYLWSSVVALWAVFNTVVFNLDIPFKLQVTVGLKFFMLVLAALFGVLTGGYLVSVLLFVILRFIWGLVFGKGDAPVAATPVAAPLVPVAPPLPAPTTSQTGGGALAHRAKAPPRIFHVSKSGVRVRKD